MFESIAKTNTTHTFGRKLAQTVMFESIAKTNTTHTLLQIAYHSLRLRVLLKQIQHTQCPDREDRKRV